MDFALSEDHLVLRQSARTFLEKEISLARVLVPGATVADADYDANWAKIVAMGWQGLVIDEAYDGLGLSCIDLAMILGEMGRSLAPSPFLGTLFGSWAIQKGGSAGAEDALLPGVAAGTTQARRGRRRVRAAPIDGPCREHGARPRRLSADRCEIVRDRRGRGRLAGGRRAGRGGGPSRVIPRRRQADGRAVEPLPGAT